MMEMAKINGPIESQEEFQKICPAILYNFEIGNCEYNETNSKRLPQGQSKLFFLFKPI